MLNEMEAAAVLALVEVYLEKQGELMRADLPFGYWILRSAQVKLRKQVPDAPRPSDMS
jgi:hypothetical protein